MRHPQYQDTHKAVCAEMAPPVEGVDSKLELRYACTRHRWHWRKHQAFGFSELRGRFLIVEWSRSKLQVGDA